MVSMDLHALGQQIAKEQDAKLAQPAELERARARWEVSLQSGMQGRPGDHAVQKPARGPLMAAAFVLTAAVLASVLLFWPEASGAPLDFRVGESNTSAEVGAWVSAPQEKPLPIEFSDGTRVVLRPEARARVVKVNPQGAHIVLESGTANVSVVPREAADWQFSVGPFQVEVVGTRFDLTWNPDHDLLELRLTEGKVNLSGCVFGTGRAVMAGEVVRASCKSGEFEIAGKSTRLTPLAEATEPEATVTPTPGNGSPARSMPSAVSTWRQMAKRGDYKDAYLALGAQFESECEKASAKELALLADVARFSGHPAQAVFALETLRQRFAGTAEAATGAFSLARLAFDQKRNYRSAAKWFETYLREQPSGPLAREALGRLMEALHRSGEARAARDVAERYLARHPTGPHARLARSLTQTRSTKKFMPSEL